MTRTDRRDAVRFLLVPRARQSEAACDKSRSHPEVTSDQDVLAHCHAFEQHRMLERPGDAQPRDRLRSRARSIVSFK